jgi:hypothetical protein
MGKGRVAHFEQLKLKSLFNRIAFYYEGLAHLPDLKLNDCALFSLCGC